MSERSGVLGRGGGGKTHSDLSWSHLWMAEIRYSSVPKSHSRGGGAGGGEGGREIRFVNKSFEKSM